MLILTTGRPLNVLTTRLTKHMGRPVEKLCYLRLLAHLLQHKPITADVYVTAITFVGVASIPVPEMENVNLPTS